MSIRNRIKRYEIVKSEDLLPNPKNWRTHPKAQKVALAGILNEVGYADAVIARETENGLMLIDGHLRLESSKNEEIPVLVLDVNEEEADLLLSTLDPLASMAGQDKVKLNELVLSLSPDSEAISALLSEMVDNPDLEKKVPEDADESDIPPETWVKEGDIFQLGNHRLLCGDSTNSQSISKLMNGAKATLMHSDPPYGMNKDFENDNLHDKDLDSFHMDWWRAWRPFMENNASAYIWGNSSDLWRLWHQAGLKDSEQLTFRNEIAWDKGSGGMAMGTEAGRMFESTERCLFFMLGNNKLGQERAYFDNTHEAMSDVWLYPPTKSTQTKEPSEETESTATDIWKCRRVTGMERYGHPTPKPVKMIVRVVKTSCEVGGIVIDPFSGTGTTIMASEYSNRSCYAMELDPRYCEITIQRWEEYTGNKAVKLNG